MMIGILAAALALGQAAATAPAATPPATPAPQPAIADYSLARPVGGSWSYSAIAGGSEARFTGVSGVVQLALRCARPARRVTISKAATAPAQSIFVWTTSASRTLAAPGFDAAAGRLNVQLGAYDPLLDAMVLSRGRIAVGAGAVPALVAPPWPEIARVVEDCRT